MLYLGVERADRIPVHARPPQRMPRQIGIAPVAKDLAIDLQIRAGAPFVPPESMLAERAVFGIEISVPERGRLDNMAVAVKAREFFIWHALVLRNQRSRVASTAMPNKEF